MLACGPDTLDFTNLTKGQGNALKNPSHAQPDRKVNSAQANVWGEPEEKGDPAHCTLCRVRQI